MLQRKPTPAEKAAEELTGLSDPLASLRAPDEGTWACMVWLHPQDPRNGSGRPQWIGEYAEEIPTNARLESDYGGGVYVLRVRTQDNTYLGSCVTSIFGAPKVVKGVQGRTASSPEIWRADAGQETRLEEKIERLAERLSNPPQGALGIAEVMASMTAIVTAALGRPEPAAPDRMGDLVSMVELLGSLRELAAPAASSESGPWGAVAQAIQAVLVERRENGRKGLPAATEAEDGEEADTEDPEVLRFEAGMTQVAAWLYRAFRAGETPEKLAPIIRQRLGPALTQLQGFTPQYLRAWFREQEPRWAGPEATPWLDRMLALVLAPGSAVGEEAQKESGEAPHEEAGKSVDPPHAV